jgi:hypothetical protein
MKLAFGLSTLLLGSSLLAGGAMAQQNGNNNSPPLSHPHSGHSSPGSGNGGGGHPNFAGPRPNWPGFHGNAQFRWNHGLNFHDRNVAHFSAQDHTLWTNGHWFHGPHNGHNGWWWYAGGAYFFYNAPIYPYPDYASDDYYDDVDGGYGPAPGYDGPPAYQGGYYWYYCNNPAGYYPYVRSCHGPWEPVQPSPPGYDNQGPGGGPDAYSDDGDDRGGPPPGYGGPNQGPPPGYGGPNQGPPANFSNQSPPGYGPNQGPPPGYNDQGGDDDGDQGPPPQPPHS